MYAIAINQGQLDWVEHETPELGDTEVRIEVAWAGMNRADSMQRQGNYPPPPGASEIPGLEVSGVIGEVGQHVTQFKPGDRVCALLAGGGYAEHVIVSEQQVLPVPDSLSLRDAAAIPEVFATAWLNLFMEAKATPGERIVLHAGASSVGTAAIQLCKSLGNPCFVTAGSDEKIKACIELGAEDGANRHSEDLVERITQWGGADVVLDPVGGDYLTKNQQILNQDGRLVMIGVMGGTKETLDLATLLFKRQRVIGSTLRSRPEDQKGAILKEMQNYVWPRLENGEITPVIDREWPIEQAQEAMTYMESNGGMGKILLKVAER
ncbi:NAD(P)H-quinone oxidoreductase [Larsenimonas suaedae]|uniref:NAD(P)H-quinone oxidoreductase n=1 Tax=Larsenimonas suaedae TaxID=1851019 RepID=A0ABU1GYI2_9GAMM|nr:NAD(P)H-quinone oxidoreductase [Larsenimonas suaedae]MCM2973175.1 NAD(P)H-quinone oxidoreductase [Larsenimonas suaedae]MDR5896612.1 NAD(P)H-quinone oxidoreductase [Larsenimonas suaedae]